MGDMTKNQIDWYNAQTNRQHYERSDAEQKRHNFGTESISREANAIQVWFNQQQADHLVRQDAINQGHYTRLDYENQRHNLQTENLQAEKQGYEYELGKESNAIKSESNLIGFEANDINRGKLANETYLVSSEAEKNRAQSENLRAQADKLRKETKYIGAEMVSKIAANYGTVARDTGSVFKDVVGTIPKLIKIIE